ncbi:MAG: hypothetical protein KA369_08350 [Spirochaetes bacterium]|nr:hypothetical protein [Spirochaetota bacterium]
MIDFIIKKGSTSVILPVSLYDSSSTTGGKLSGLVYNSSGLTAYYNRMGASGSAVAITLATATKGTWATGGFVAIDGTNMPGDYELHIPNAALESGANHVLIQIKGASNLAPKNILIKLVDNEEKDTYDIVNHANYGNAQLVRSTTPANTLDVSSTGEAGLDFANIKDAASAKTLNNITIPTVTTVTDAVGVSAMADAVLDEVVEGTLTLRHMMRIFEAALAGKLTITDNGTTYTFAFRDVADSKDRISVTVNKTSKNRTAVTVDGA